MGKIRRKRDKKFFFQNEINQEDFIKGAEKYDIPEDHRGSFLLAYNVNERNGKENEPSSCSTCNLTNHITKRNFSFSPERRKVDLNSCKPDSVNHPRCYGMAL